MASIVAQYLFDEGSGTTLIDHSGNGLNGTLGAGATAPTWVSGGGLLFDGVDDIVTVTANNLFNLPNAHTIETIFKWTAGNGGIVDHTGAGATNKNWQFMIEGGFYRYRTVKGGGNVDETGTATPTSGTIYHVICTYNGTKMTMYVSGVAQPQTSVAAPLDVTNGDIYIGHLGSGVYPFNGTIYKLVIYDYALTPGDVADLQALRASGERTTAEYTGAEDIVTGLRTATEYTDTTVRVSGLRTITDFTAATSIVTALRTIWEYEIGPNPAPPPGDTGLPPPPPVNPCPDTNLGQGPPVPRGCEVQVGGIPTTGTPLTYGVGFRLYRKDCEIRMKQWGAIDSYNIVKPFGGESFERGAEI